VFHLMTLPICQWQWNDMWVGSIGGWHRQQTTQVLRDSPVSVLFCSSPIPCRPARDWNQASVVRGQWWMEKEWSSMFMSKILENAFTLNTQDIKSLKSLYQNHTKFQTVLLTTLFTANQPPPETDNTNRN